MAKRQAEDPDEVERPDPDDDEKGLEKPEHPIIAAKDRPKVTPLEGETTRVLLTGDGRTVLTEEYVPTAEFGFRIKVGEQWYEHVSDGEGGVWIFAPTR